MKIRNLYFFLLLLLTASTACKKTVDYEPLAQNRITSFLVTNVKDTVIYGAVDNVANTITVYVPYYYGLTVIQPKITVETGATLTTTVAPVDIASTTQTYAVKGSDGSTRTYKLNIVAQNTPDLKLDWADLIDVSPGVTMPTIIGNFLSTSNATLAVDMLNKATQKTLVVNVGDNHPITNYNSKYPGTYFLDLPVPLAADSGSYDVTVHYLGHAVKLAKPLHVTYLVPDVAPSYSAKTAARGGTITFYANLTNYFINLQSVKVKVNNTLIDLPISNNARAQADLKIPADFPTGDLGTCTFTFQFGNWAPVTTTSQLIITP